MILVLNLSILAAKIFAMESFTAFLYVSAAASVSVKGCFGMDLDAKSLVGSLSFLMTGVTSAAFSRFFKIYVSISV